ncbi:DUF6924 domain-containing protein [Streptomyces microflavus]|uniref:DUF6924 domain-containing protein n=1 Tax=Streptomyces microflavus TaxID=1919 RepID=UPI003691EE79
MRTLPRTDEFYPELLVIRTDYRDERAWEALKEALAEPWGPKGEESVQEVLYVDDPAWAEAGVEDVLTALTDDEEEGEGGWSVVFIADHLTLESDSGDLLAVDTDTSGSDMEDYSREVRTDRRAAPHDMHCNLSLGNTDFYDYVPKKFF